MTRIVLGPFNRVEGDLEVALDVSAGQVQAAHVNSPLFRGFEQLLVHRAAPDALVIVPRICGICSVAQSAAAAAALAHWGGVQMPANGRLCQYLIQATENLADHLSHFYLFFMPDFARPAYAARPWFEGAARRFAAQAGTATADALRARAGFLQLMGFLAGRWPHTLALQPGGSTKPVTAAERVRILALLRGFRAFVEHTVLGDTLEGFAAIESETGLRAWGEGRVADFPHFLALAYALGLERVGRAADRFLSYGAYGRLAPGMAAPGAARQPLDAACITEDAHHAWLAQAAPLHPAQGETVVAADKAQAYTWCKAPRYGGQVCETGALARQVVDGHPLACDLVARHGASVTARVVARMIELATLVPAMEQWVRELVPGEPFCTAFELPHCGQGVGLVEAARGGLGHWFSVKNGLIERYQIIAPTTWNFSPRDALGQGGPLEQALVGLPVGDAAPPTLQHVVRSFDPCMVCTVH